MDVDNNHLRSLITKTEVAFRQLMQHPSSEPLNQAYEEAKNKLNQYIHQVKQNHSGEA